MPTSEQMDAVTQKIEWLKSMSYFQEEGRIPETASDCFLPWWEDLSREEQQAVLNADVDWEDFTEAQREDVINRVLAGEDVEFWLDGIGEDGQVQTVAQVAEEERFYAAQDMYEREREYYADDPFYDMIGREMEAAQVADDDGTPFLPPEVMDKFRERIADYETAKQLDADDSGRPDTPKQNRDEIAAMFRDIADPPKFDRYDPAEHARPQPPKDKDRGPER